MPGKRDPTPELMKMLGMSMEQSGQGGANLQKVLEALNLGDTSMLPERFKGARSTYVSPGDLPKDTLGKYNYPPAKMVNGRLKADPGVGSITLRPEAIKAGPAKLLAHELGHSIWANDLPRGADDSYPKEKEDWSIAHQIIGMLNPKPTTPAGRYPADPHHSFAEAVSEYMTNPGKLRKESPKFHEFLKVLFGKEYDK